MAQQGHYQELDVPPKFMKIRELVGEASKKPTATLKELQKSLASTGSVLHVTTISHILHMNGLWGRGARWRPFLTKKNIQALLDPPNSMWENVLWSDETKVELGTKTTLHITQRTPYPQ
uniref:Transposase Tc1-like domain-containing protein n=1 Tax=Esox lucius TaxID=8010 RepID=A0AAY5KMI4_ESOLU